MTNVSYSRIHTVRKSTYTIACEKIIWSLFVCMHIPHLSQTFPLLWFIASYDVAVEDLFFCYVFRVLRKATYRLLTLRIFHAFILFLLKILDLRVYKRRFFMYRPQGRNHIHMYTFCSCIHICVCVPLGNQIARFVLSFTSG